MCIDVVIQNEQVLRSLSTYDTTGANSNSSGGGSNGNGSRPYFVFWALHIAHVPLQVPRQYYDRYEDLAGGDVGNHARQIYQVRPLAGWLAGWLAG